MIFNRIKENKNFKFENKAEFVEIPEPLALVNAVMQLGTISIGSDILCFSVSGVTPITNMVVDY